MDNKQLIQSFKLNNECDEPTHILTLGANDRIKMKIIFISLCAVIIANTKTN